MKFDSSRPLFFSQCLDVSTLVRNVAAGQTAASLSIALYIESFTRNMHYKNAVL